MICRILVTCSSMQDADLVIRDNFDNRSKNVDTHVKMPTSYALNTYFNRQYIQIAILFHHTILSYTFLVGTFSYVLNGLHAIV